jgi:glycosyltransferase involved in cell wall biosynthesis
MHCTNDGFGLRKGRSGHMELKIVHVVAGLWKDTGGPAEVIPNLCRAQAESGAKVVLCSINGDNAPQLEALTNSNVEVRLFKAFDTTLRYSPCLAAYLHSVSDVDIIHNHGHWLWPNWCASAAARIHNVRLVSTPHGTLVPGMLARSPLKKAVAWALFDRRLIKRADVIHALSVAERDAMAPKLGSWYRKIVVIPNGVHVPKCSGQHTGEDGGTLLFLSRVTPIKGVIQLLNAWRRLAPRHLSWRLKIVGPIDEGLREQIQSLSSEIARIELTGPVYADERWGHYKGAAAFILPTFGEGLPTVLLEAAAHRLPVITTPEANFTELHEAGGSLLTSADADSIERALDHFFCLPPTKRKAIGECGAQLIADSYEWGALAARWLSVYEDIVSRK